MPLSAAFGFFSSFSLREETFTSISLSSISSFSSLILLHFGETSFGTYIRNLAYYTIKYNKKSGDLIAKSPSSINTLYITI